MVVSIKEAQKNFNELFKKAVSGQEVLIQNDEGVTVKITLESKPVKTRGLVGSAKGLVKMSDDFTAPLADIEAAIYGDA
jgi:antitoxin (DNA-binding transcriptional repressor) of toxin-antitoxin stability system